MKPAKLRQINRVQSQVRLLEREPHVMRCLCCQSDCQALYEAADSPHAEVFLVRIVRRCHEAAMRATTPPEPPLASGTRRGVDHEP